MTISRFSDSRTFTDLATSARLAAVGTWILTLFVLTTAHCSAALIHHWRFDEPDGTAAPQVQNSASGNHGTFNANMNDTNRSSDVPISIATYGGRSLQFDGVDAVPETAVLNNLIVLDDTSNFTLAFWYKGTETRDFAGTFGRTLIGWNSGNIYANFIIRNGKAEFLHFNGGWMHNIASTTSINDDEWHHVAFVNHANQKGDLYIDGVAEKTNENSIADHPAFPFTIEGFMRGYSNVSAQGSLDDVRVYDEALTGGQVLELTQAPVPEPSTGLLLVGLLLSGRYVRCLRARNAGRQRSGRCQAPPVPPVGVVPFWYNR